MVLPLGYVNSISSVLCVCMCVCSLSRISFSTPWTVACQSLPFTEFSQQEYWSGLPLPPPVDPPNPGSNPHFLSLLHWQADFFFFFYHWASWETFLCPRIDWKDLSHWTFCRIFHGSTTSVNKCGKYFGSLDQTYLFQRMGDKSYEE